MQFEVIFSSIPFLLGGVAVTLKFTALSLLCGLPLGLLFAFFKISDHSFLRGFAHAYTAVFRGTPLIVQLSIIFFGLPVITGHNMTPLVAAVLTFSLNSAAYISEHIRSGLVSVDKGQWEAAHLLGLSHFQTFRYIILPQAFRSTLPSLVNEWIDLLKESSIVFIIGEADLFRRAQVIAGEKFLYFEPYLTVALCYFVMVMALTWFSKRLEKRLAYA